MLFKNINALTAKGVKVTIEITDASEGKLEVSVIPTSLSGKSGVSLVAKSFVATPEELDAEFADVIGAYATANASLREQLVAFDLQIEQAAEEAKAQVVEKAKTSATATKSSVQSAGTRKGPSAAKAPVDPNAELLDFSTPGASTVASQPDADGDGDGDGSVTESVAGQHESVASPMAFTL